MAAAERVVVVGASLAGFRAAHALRAGGFDGPLTLVGAEPYEPYDRPPLSKELLAGTTTEDAIALAVGGLGSLDLDLRLGTAAVDLDVSGQAVVLHGGDRVAYDHVVIATGARARALPGVPELDGLFTVRTLDDSRGLGKALRSGSPRVVVVGAGFIGAEVASTARAMDLEVTVLEALPVPLARGLGPVLGPAVAGLQVEGGVDLRLGVAVSAVEGDGRVERVVLSDGTHIDADLVVVGIGAVPNTGWLEASGLELRDGLVCDETCRALGAGNVWAAGDVARWPHPLYGEVRLEHWDNAAKQGAAVGANVAAVLRGEAPKPYGGVPSVWSDQFGRMIQVLGHVSADDAVDVVLGSLDDRSFVALLSEGGSLTGAVAIADPRVNRFRRLLADRASLDEGLALAAKLR
jgi:NADPH-dependent 2,4-dienoyl-CoA reductase/sulfur reductase-like enzyme